MVKIVIGVLAALVIAVGGYFGFEYYLQQRIANDIEAAFANVRASGAKASHGKVAFDLWSRTITVADIAGEFTAQPPASLKIGRVTASGVSQRDAGRFAADRIDATDIEVAGAIGQQTGLRFNYHAPRIEISDYAGPGGPLRPLGSTAAAADIYRFALEHFAAVTAKSVAAPTVAVKLSATGSAAGAGDYTYTGVVLRDIKDGKIAASTVDRVTFTAAMTTAGKTETFTGDVANLAAFDFDAAATMVMLDPAHANDDKYYRAYRQMTVGPYSASFQQGLRMRVEGVTIDDVGVRPSKLQFPQLMAIVDAAPPPGTTPTTEQMRDLLGKVAGIYEGIRIGNAEVRGLSMDTPQGPFRLAAIRLTNLENGKVGEFALEGLDAKAPQGPVKVGRFALKALDVANLMRASGQFAVPGRNPSTEQLAALLLLLEGTEVANLVAPYKDTSKPINIDTLNLAWGQFVGPIPTRARVTVKMTGPVDVTDPDPFKTLALSGMSNASVNFDLGAAWTEGTRSFALEPATLEIGNLFTAVARASLANVARETFSLNPLQAAIMAAQIEAGPIEIVLRDTGGIELAIAQQARQQNISREAARRAMTDSIRDNAMKMASVNPDVMAIAGALTRFIENPRGTLTVKLVPRGKVGMMQIVDAMKRSPVAALARFQVEATTGR
ncbi:MAG: hypothetical protein QOF14_4732 [Hyphomicrobiales bacterium]|nr:hypothetical protein [Hyphomicrobiales bacterium]